MLASIDSPQGDQVERGVRSEHLGCGGEHDESGGHGAGAGEHGHAAHHRGLRYYCQQTRREIRPEPCPARRRPRRLFNQVISERVEAKDGRIHQPEYRPVYRPPFNQLFPVPEFEYGTRVEVAGIEPASSGPATGLLRAQPAPCFSAPPVPQAGRCGLSYCWMSRPLP